LTVLAVDDEQPILSQLEITLRAQGFHAVSSKTRADAPVRATTAPPDSFVVDLGLPDSEGIDIVWRIRKRSIIPLIILSARGSEEEIVRSLDAGADDFLVKQFRTTELAARIRTALRHPSPLTKSNTLSFGSMTIDFLGHKAEKRRRCPPERNRVRRLFSHEAKRRKSD
jgi:two-component system KDP operon response regulator KdpE